ncbi:MAG: hypothetical protein GJ676_18380 [Rhodobacteraceae bacterium]|nr:hypothetical protein [Paracoccaceae bacterium]
MTRIKGSAPHKKFIATILIAALAVTGFTATPARADEDVAKVLAGLAALAIIGAAISNDRDDHVVHRRQPVRIDPNPNKQNHVRPIPPAIARYDLPRQCVRSFPELGGKRVLGLACLKQNYRHVQALPYACRVSVERGRKQRTGYETLCLRERGYRISHR